jgi:hypothetical protein
MWSSLNDGKAYVILNSKATKAKLMVNHHQELLLPSSYLEAYLLSYSSSAFQLPSPHSHLPLHYGCLKAVFGVLLSCFPFSFNSTFLGIPKTDSNF